MANVLQATVDLAKSLGLTLYGVDDDEFVIRKRGTTKQLTGRMDLLEAREWLLEYRDSL